MKPEDGEKRVRTEGLWLKCEKCGQIVWRKALEDNFQVCPKCGHHGRLDAGVELLGKPYTQRALAQRVREMLDRAGATEGRGPGNAAP